MIIQTIASLLHRAEKLANMIIFPQFKCDFIAGKNRDILMTCLQKYFNKVGQRHVLCIVYSISSFLSPDSHQKSALDGLLGGKPAS